MVACGSARRLEIGGGDPIHTFAKLRPLGAVSSFQNRNLDRSEGEKFPKGSVSTFQNPELGGGEGEVDFENQFPESSFQNGGSG